MVNILQSQEKETTGNLEPKVKDVEGFMNTRWGMTEDQILESMKGEAVKLKSRKNYRFNWYATVGIKEVTIDSNKYTVHFLMNKGTNLLQQVNLDIFYQNIEDPDLSFASLKNAFEKDYGKPTAESKTENPKNHSVIFQAAWVFPSTIILYTAWSKNLDKSLLQFFQNDGTRSLKSLGIEPK